jgi:hypothetical protein
LEESWVVMLGEVGLTVTASAAQALEVALLLASPLAG